MDANVQIYKFIQHPHFSALAPSANHLQINQRILSRQKSNGMNVITSGGRSLTQQICLYVGGGRYILRVMVFHCLNTGEKRAT